MTRPAHQADDFAQRLREAGAEPILAPAIAIGPPADPAAARAAVARAHEYDWAVFTSRNGVDAFFAVLDELGRSTSGDVRPAQISEDGTNARVLEGVRVAAIGPKTARALAARGVHVDLVPAVFVNEAVAAALIARTAPGERIAIYRAQEAREILPEKLREHGRIVTVAALYATALVDDPGMAAKAERADVVTFASASSVTGFVRNVPNAATLLAAKTVAAIGPITAATVRAAGLHVDAVADEFTVEGLVRALEATTA